MNILTVNPVHPSTPHISAVRVWCFAQELANRGHHVVHLTGYGADTARSRMSTSHDWSAPIVVGFGEITPDFARHALPRLLARALTAVRMVRHGGRQGEWVKAAVAGIVRSAGDFRPDVVWCTFGMLEGVFVAKRIAKIVGCPWVLDVKDNWELYVPHGIRKLMAWRISGWSAATANAHFTADVARRWLHASPSVIYSGVDPAFAPAQLAPEHSQARFVINLVGGIYFQDRLAEFLRGVNSWVDGLPEDVKSNVVVRYLGGDGAAVEAAALRHAPGLVIEPVGYVQLAEMARRCSQAAVNAYIANPSTFHHKLLELLACARPILAYGSEHRESFELVAQTGGTLSVAEDASAVRSALDSIHVDWRNRRPVRVNVERLKRYSWARQAEALEQVLIAARMQ